MKYLGDFLPGQPVRIPWSTNAKTGSAVSRTAVGTVRVYKGSSTTEWTNGIIDSANFDAVTGLQFNTLDISDTSFYVAHEDYAVALVGAIIDGETVNAWLANFSILNRGTNVLITPGVVSGVFLPSSSRVLIDGISLASGALNHHELRMGYGNALSPQLTVIAAHVLSGGRADLTFVSPTIGTMAVGSRVLVF